MGTQAGGAQAAMKKKTALLLFVLAGAAAQASSGGGRPVQYFGSAPAAQAHCPNDIVVWLNLRIGVALH